MLKDKLVSDNDGGMPMNPLGRFAFAVALALPATVGADTIRTETVRYQSGDTDLQGFMAWNAAQTEPGPGVLVVHEWWGQNEHARNSARRLAEMGYTALALDMYGEGRVAEHPRDAGEMAGQVRNNADVAAARFEAASALLRGHPSVDGERIAAIGYCFGGSVVLEMARRGADLQGVASIHGALGTDNPAQPGQVQAEVLVLHGADDPLVPEDQVNAFREEMRQAGVDFRFVAFPGATHSFTNPDADRIAREFDMPVGYNAEAEAATWRELDSFLQRVTADGSM